MPDFHLPPEALRTCFPQFLRIDPFPKSGQKLVYRAEHKDGTAFALKIIIQDQGTQDQRAIREIEAAASLRSPCFANILEAKCCQILETDCIFIIEEFIDGQSLASVLKKQVPQSLSFIRDVGSALLNGLTKVEEAKLVHRDIKPGNIMIGEDGRIVIIDFGIVRNLGKESITSSCALQGPMTPGYGAPEQIRNCKRQISIRTDLFAVGVVLYEMAVGRNPFYEVGNYSRELVNERCLNLDPPPLSTFGCPQGLSDFVEKCMYKPCHRRLPTASKALESFTAINWEV